MMQALLSLAAKPATIIKEDWQKYIYAAARRKGSENKI